MARVLGVPVGFIDSWTEAKSWPRPDHLWVIIEVLKSRDWRGHDEPLGHFLTLAERPTEEVSIHGQHMLPTSLPIWNDRG